MRIARICGNGHFSKGDGPCPECVPDTSHRSPLYPNGVQIGMIDGETVGYYPRWAGPYVDYPRSIKRRVKNKADWKDRVKRQEGRFEDIS